MFGHTLALCAGFCAASASTCAKLAMAEKETLKLCLTIFSLFYSFNTDDSISEVLTQILNDHTKETTKYSSDCCLLVSKIISKIDFVWLLKLHQS